VSQRDLAEQISKIQGIEEVHIISGEWDIIAKVRSSSIEDIGDLILDRIRALEGVGSTITCVSFSVVKSDM
jgi:DNA-binding Lrp family transcriptional regulator